MAVELYVLDGGLIDILDWSIYDPSAAAGSKRTLADPVYLVVHPAGTLVWDAGLPDSLAGRTEPLVVDNHAVFQVSNSVAGQLEKAGHPAQSIDFFGLSHFHVDHVGNVSLFADATLLAQRDEYDAAFGPDAVAHHYDPEAYSGLAQNRVVLLDGDHDVFGDGTVVVKRLPGHTIGSQALLVRLAQTGPVVVSGDVTHSAQSWRTNAIPAALNYDLAESAQSLKLMRELLEQEGATLWIQHDHEQYLGLRRSPEPYV